MMKRDFVPRTCHSATNFDQRSCPLNVQKPLPFKDFFAVPLSCHYERAFAGTSREHDHKKTLALQQLFVVGRVGLEPTTTEL